MMAQERRKAMLEKRRQRKVTALCIAGGLGAAVLSVAACLLVFGPKLELGQPTSAPAHAAVEYDASQPFSLSDLTADQLAQARQQGRVSVSDGPRGVSIGDSLDLLLERFPANYAGEQPADEQILYCADTFTSAGGALVALPPRGTLTATSSDLFVTLLAPTSAYPAGTRENYGQYEHVYCQFTIEPNAMTVSAIVLGIEK